MDSLESRIVGSVRDVMMRPTAPARRERAKEIFGDVISEYNMRKRGLKPEQSINLVCLIGGGVFDVYSVAAKDDFIEIVGKSGEHLHIITAPIEQVAFDIIISKTTTAEPPREIGFGAIAKEHQKAEQATA
ncbi:MAG: hypothetical protein ABSE16_06015 [Verrucomicrobiota bacterium]